MLHTMRCLFAYHSLLRLNSTHLKCFHEQILFYHFTDSIASNSASLSIYLGENIKKWFGEKRDACLEGKWIESIRFSYDMIVVSENMEEVTQILQNLTSLVKNVECE